jgi:hypothetical protein
MPLTVKQLQEFLSTADPDAQVLGLGAVLYEIREVASARDYFADNFDLSGMVPFSSDDLSPAVVKAVQERAVLVIFDE